MWRGQTWVCTLIEVGHWQPPHRRGRALLPPLLPPLFPLRCSRRTVGEGHAVDRDRIGAVRPEGDADREAEGRRRGACRGESGYLWYDSRDSTERVATPPAAAPATEIETLVVVSGSVG